MMAGEAEEAWRAFLAESEEHLEAADQLLSRAGAGAAREDVASLFRAFHSLKGLSMAMDLPNMQAVAHHAEDLLGLVREGRAALGGPASAMLLEVVDCLRAMRDWMEAHHADAAPAPDLAARLAQMVQQASGGASGGAAAPAPVPDLTSDGEMLGMYCELLAEQAPVLAEALGSRSAEAVAAAEELVLGADVVGLDQVASVLRAVVLHAGAVADPAARSALVLALAGLTQQLGLLEEIAGVPAGADALAAGLARHAQADVAARAAALRAALAGEAELGPAVVLATEARIAFDAAGMGNAAATLLLLEDQLSRANQAEIAWTPALAALARDMAAAVAGLDADLDPDAAAGLRADWLSRMQGGPPTLTQPALAPELNAALTGEQAARFEQRIAGGWHAFDLLLDTEAEPDIAADLTAWLSTNTEVVTSRTVSAGSMSWFEFLFASRDPLDAVQAALAALDPGRACIKGLRQVSAATGATAGLHDPRAAGPMIRVRVDAVDAMLDGLDAMRITIGSMAEAIASLRGTAPKARVDEAAELQQRMAAMHRQVRAACLGLRVVPVDTVFARYPRMVRELATRLGREVGFEILGHEARIDKGMADLLIDPLMHLIRNAIDHGIEPPDARIRVGKPRRARLVLAATEHAAGVDIAVRDDGRGLDRSAILAHAQARGLVQPGAAMSDRDVYHLLFRSGFSTAAEVTEISGRGVGLDVVAHAVSRLGGSIEIDTAPGAGTSFTMRVPASASVQDVLLVEAGELVGIPQRRVLGVASLDTAEVVGGAAALWYRDGPVPLHDLAALLGFPAPPPTVAVIVDNAGHLAAFAVAQIPRRREVFLKELHPTLAALPEVAGATMLSDGRAVLVLDVDGLLRRAARDRVAP